MWEAAFWGAFSASSLLIGGAVALRWGLSPRIVGLVMGFGAGALISAVSFELIEEAIAASAGSGAAGLGLAAGALVFFGGDWYIDRRGGEQRKDIGGEGAEGNAGAIVLGTILDGIPESIVVGGSLVAGGGVSIAMVAAAFLSNLPEAVGATTGLKKGGMPGRRVMGLWLVIVIVSAGSAGVGYVVLDDASANLGAVFQGFAAGAILTMLVDTMIPEAFEEGGKAVGLVTVLGFAVAVFLSQLE
jgi:zinc transporter, ZIP family